jgi:release factor glutamine methyltransferase
MTIDQLSAEVRRSLAAAYDAQEAQALARIIMEQLLQMTRTQLLVRGDYTVPDFIEAKARTWVTRLLDGEPIQHITGRARFCGMELRVTPDVLIPRPETEILVDLITDRFGSRRDLRVLDLGTGSGCIAIALARALPFARVTAIDVSEAALAVAKANAREFSANVDFCQGSILELDAIGGEWDVMVSNPPYVLESERASIPANVIGHDPDLALFVPNDDPLRFYTPTIRFARDGHLAADGGLFFEINPLCADQYAGAELQRDQYGRIRFAIYKNEKQ